LKNNLVEGAIRTFLLNKIYREEQKKTGLPVKCGFGKSFCNYRLLPFSEPN